MDYNPQREHYKQIHDAYGAHYYDPTSMLYREKFIYQSLFKNLDLDGATVADLACGEGVTSLALKQLFPSVNMVGFDISASACESYEALIGSPAVEIDLVKPFTNYDSQFDAAIIVGGLHHCVLDLTTTLNNIAKILKPGGLLLMFEPNADFLFEGVRKLWYRNDHYFDHQSEHALSHNTIFTMTQGKFEVMDVSYVGGPAYFLVLNSLISRVPLRAKSSLVRPLFLLESIYNRLPGRFMFPAFAAQWKKIA